MCKDITINMQRHVRSSHVACNVSYFFARHRHVFNFNHLNMEGSVLARIRDETIITITHCSSVEKSSRLFVVPPKCSTAGPGYLGGIRRNTIQTKLVKQARDSLQLSRRQTHTLEIKISLTLPNNTTYKNALSPPLSPLPNPRKSTTIPNLSTPKKTLSLPSPSLATKNGTPKTPAPNASFVLSLKSLLTSSFFVPATISFAFSSPRTFARALATISGSPMGWPSTQKAL